MYKRQQLSRDQQALNEKKIEHEINKISLKEILNIKGDFKTNKEQNLTGFWNHKLNKNINVGLDKNLSLKNLILQKLIKKTQAETFLAQNKPNIYISNSLSSTFSKGDSLATNIDSKKSGSNYTNTISLNFAWNIFDGGQNKNSYKSKIADAESEKYAYENLKNVLTTSISKAYLNLKLNEEKIISSLKEIESSKESVRLSRLRYDVGISTLKDVLVRQSELSNAKSKNINAIYNYNLNIDELERLTFLAKSKNCLDRNNTKINSEKSGSNYTNTISLNFAWSIFNGGQNKSSYKSKIADAESEDYSYKNLKNVLTTNISKAYLELRLNEDKIISSFKEIESSKESVRLSRLRYDVGISTLKDVLVRQSELSNAKSKNINAIYNYNLNLDELERLTFLEISKNCLDINNNKNIDRESICNIPK